jgi:hypothetical protein
MSGKPARVEGYQGAFEEESSAGARPQFPIGSDHRHRPCSREMRRGYEPLAARRSRFSS